jgi:hypothetical protein
MSIVEVTKTFAAQGTSDTISIAGKFNFSLDLNGGGGTFQLQRYNGTNWKPIAHPLTESTDMTASTELTGEDSAKGGSLYRVECTVYGSGSPVARIWF